MSDLICKYDDCCCCCYWVGRLKWNTDGTKPWNHQSNGLGILKDTLNGIEFYAEKHSTLWLLYSETTMHLKVSVLCKDIRCLTVAVCYHSNWAVDLIMTEYGADVWKSLSAMTHLCLRSSRVGGNHLNETASTSRTLIIPTALKHLISKLQWIKHLNTLSQPACPRLLTNAGALNHTAVNARDHVVIMRSARSCLHVVVVVVVVVYRPATGHTTVAAVL